MTTEVKMMQQVKNLQTGLVHTVPQGHFSLNSPEYEVMESVPVPVKETEPEAKPLVKPEAVPTVKTTPVKK